MTDKCEDHELYTNVLTVCELVYFAGTSILAFVLALLVS